MHLDYSSGELRLISADGRLAAKVVILALMAISLVAWISNECEADVNTFNRQIPTGLNEKIVIHMYTKHAPLCATG